MKFFAYPAYKPVNEELAIKRIPSHWSAIRVRFLLRNGSEGIKIGPFGSALKLDDMVDAGFKVYGQVNVIKNDFDAGNRYIDLPKYKEMSVYDVKSNDIMITMMGTSGKCRIVPEGVSPGIFDSHITRVRTSKNINPKFFEWLVNEAEPIQYQTKILGKGSIMHGLNSEIIKSLLLPVPPLDEQTQIAAFLDRETAKIDQLIEKQQRLIKLLEEKRQAIISHAVTKGLNPDAPMKDSGVEWLGEVPEHWQVVPLKHLCNFSGGGTPSKENLDYWNGDIPWVSPKDMKTAEINGSIDKITELAVQESSTSLLEAGAVLIVVRSGILQHSIPVAINRVSVALNQDMKALRFNQKLVAEFMINVIRGNQRSLLMAWGKQGATVESIEQEYMANTPVPVPPLTEQKQIIDEIARLCVQIDQLSNKAKQAINLMKERRTTLISAAVTGKIDVRDEVPQDVEEAVAS